MNNFDRQERENGSLSITTRFLELYMVYIYSILYMAKTHKRTERLYPYNFFLTNSKNLRSILVIAYVVCVPVLSSVDDKGHSRIIGKKRVYIFIFWTEIYPTLVLILLSNSTLFLEECSYLLGRETLPLYHLARF